MDVTPVMADGMRRQKRAAVAVRQDEDHRRRIGALIERQAADRKAPTGLAAAMADMRGAGTRTAPGPVRSSARKRTAGRVAADRKRQRERVCDPDFLRDRNAAFEGAFDREDRARFVGGHRREDGRFVLVYPGGREMVVGPL